MVSDPDRFSSPEVTVVNFVTLRSFAHSYITVYLQYCLVKFRVSSIVSILATESSDVSTLGVCFPNHSIYFCVLSQYFDFNQWDQMANLVFIAFLLQAKVRSLNS